jgi:hypothetical protein
MKTPVRCGSSSGPEKTLNLFSDRCQIDLHNRCKFIADLPIASRFRTKLGPYIQLMCGGIPDRDLGGQQQEPLRVSPRNSTRATYITSLLCAGPRETCSVLIHQSTPTESQAGCLTQRMREPALPPRHRHVWATGTPANRRSQYVPARNTTADHLATAHERSCTRRRMPGCAAAPRSAPTYSALPHAVAGSAEARGWQADQPRSGSGPRGCGEDAA